MFSTSEKMHALEQIKNRQTITAADSNPFLILDLISNRLVCYYQNTLELTHAGSIELNNWDPLLNVYINNWAIMPSYGDA